MSTDALRALEQRTDLADRAAIEALLRRFYGRVLVDHVLAEPFQEIRAKGLESHLPVMCDFWETVLFGAKLYPRRLHRARDRTASVLTSHPS
ncbi:hypothetical protein [Jongsikchunia kroppenstedtii]|uniref:hypothetical protein n=1 Tax=Jongsikchunia kroppenstedtii TaxID=1121721 RepID=UPI00036CFE92|nr:hypothetical protein [Jongsikchunia kroppenstedtii]